MIVRARTSSSAIFPSPPTATNSEALPSAIDPSEGTRPFHRLSDMDSTSLQFI